MNTRLNAAIARLKTLYAMRGENQIFARMLVPLPADRQARLEREAATLAPDACPAIGKLLPLWEDYLSFTDALEDDWVPAIYPRPYDQGLYGTLFGAAMEFNPVQGPGWMSSNTRTLEGTPYAELMRLAAHPDWTWAARLESDLRVLSAAARGRWAVAVPITIDGFNLAMQIRGNDTMLDITDCPDDLKAFLQAGVRLNIELVERLHAAIAVRPEGGIGDFFNAGWMPGNAIPMSVDCYNLCAAETYAEFGRPYQQQLLDRFGGGNFHLHGNGRHLLPQLARLKGCVVAWIGNDGSDVAALDDLEGIKQRAGSVIPAVPCLTADFVRRLRDRSLAGGIHYTVGPVASIAEANRLMETVRNYRV